MTLASDERAALADTFDKVGPDRPTLCGDWTTQDLLAHLLVRERQPWASGGILVPALAPITERAMRGYAKTPWSELVDEWRAGAPLWSPFRLGKVDEMANGAEHFVHHEDVRRGEPGWEPRPADPKRDAQVWALVGRSGRMMYRHSPVGVILRRPSGEQAVVKTGPGSVTVVGEPSELLLHGFGRDEIRVTFEGDPADLAELQATSRGI
ncbi:TIGR03085 family metal-binding protein [Pseudonocardia sp. GCM10023141]|uniref:TIGR03085 family metal-binding protein n=1 Tax=Pseudonocardia sp. GCM10023141 TaxID=3252653 RepID=UPI00361D1D72